MRELAIVPVSKLHPSRTLSFEQLALVEPLSIGAHAVSRAQLADGENVLVVGAGPIGLAVTQFALLAGAKVMVMDISERRLTFCQQLWPQVVCVDGRGDPLAALQYVVADDLPTAVFDATGNPQSMMSAFTYVVSTISRFVEQTWTSAVRAALIQSSFPSVPATFQEVIGTGHVLERMWSGTSSLWTSS